MTAEPLWKIALRRGVEALDWRVQKAGDETWVSAHLTRQLADQPQARPGAYAAIEIDKLVTRHQLYDEPGLKGAAELRAKMAYELLHNALDYDAVIRSKESYRAALVEAVWDRVKDDPAEQLASLAAPHEDE